MPTRTQANSYLIPTRTLTNSYLLPTRTQTISYQLHYLKYQTSRTVPESMLGDQQVLRYSSRVVTVREHKPIVLWCLGRADDALSVDDVSEKSTSAPVAKRGRASITVRWAKPEDFSLIHVKLESFCRTPGTDMSDTVFNTRDHIMGLQLVCRSINVACHQRTDGDRSCWLKISLTSSA